MFDEQINRILDLAFLSRMQLLENYDYNDEYDDYEADDGDLIVKNSGPIEAVEFWNNIDLTPKNIYRDEE